MVWTRPFLQRLGFGVSPVWARNPSMRGFTNDQAYELVMKVAAGELD